MGRIGKKATAIQRLLEAGIRCCDCGKKAVEWNAGLPKCRPCFIGGDEDLKLRVGDRSSRGDIQALTSSVDCGDSQVLCRALDKAIAKHNIGFDGGKMSNNYTGFASQIGESFTLAKAKKVEKALKVRKKAK